MQLTDAFNAGHEQNTLESCLQQLARLRVSQSRECLQQLFTLLATSGGCNRWIQSFTAADLLRLFCISPVDQRSQLRSEICELASPGTSGSSVSKSTLGFELCRTSMEWCSAQLKQHLQAVVELYRNDVLRRDCTEIFESQV